MPPVYIEIKKGTYIRALFGLLFIEEKSQNFLGETNPRATDCDTISPMRQSAGRGFESQRKCWIFSSINQGNVSDSW